MGGGKGQSKQSIPQWAQNVGMSILGGPGFQSGPIQSSGGLYGDSYGTGADAQLHGPAADLVGGYQSASPQQLWGGLSQLPGMAAMLGPAYAQAGAGLSGQAAGQDQLLGQGGMFGAGQSNGLNQMMPGFLSQAQGAYGNLNNLLSMDPSKIMSMFNIAGGGGSKPASPFSGQVEGAALGQMGSMDPNGDIYNRAMALMKPQVRSGFADRGLVGGGQAIQAEGDQARQLADTMAQQSAQNKIGLLGQAAAGEGANASMTNALGQWNLGLGQQGGQLFNSLIQGGLGATQAPGQMFGQMQSGIGGGLQNMAGAQGLNQGGLGALLQGQNLSMQGLQMPGAISQQVYQDTRAPLNTMLQALTGASGLSHPAGKVK